MAFTADSLMARLREDTRDLHEHAESRTLQRRMARGELPRQTFVAYLAQLHWIHSALESALARSRGAHAAIDAVATEDRFRVPDLLADLAHHGGDPAAALPAAVGFCETIAALEAEGPVALLGCLYVLEGSTNGARFIARVLRRAWGIEGREGLAYMDPYGDAQPERWAAFRREMDAADFSGVERNRIVSAARATFEAIASVSDELMQASAV